MTKSMLILGATGFIGHQVARQAIGAGWQVKALVRSEAGAEKLAACGATAVLGAAENVSSWVAELADVAVVIDLVQPKIPAKLTLSGVQTIAAKRVQITRCLLEALAALPASQRPLLISVSGTDDLQPDAHGHIGATSPLKRILSGFSHIGIPVRRCIEQSGLDAMFVYLGSVYGPGKTFADVIVPRIVSGKWKTVGTGENSIPLIHVEDAARALVHLAGIERTRLKGRTFVLADEAAVSSREFFEHTAALLGARKPGTAPAWLASLIAGSIMVETMTRDLVVDVSAIKATGFTFKYPSFREGLTATLHELGRTAAKPRPTSRRPIPFWLITAATFGTLIAENTLPFKWSVPSMLALSNGLPLLDMRFTYSVEDAYRLFDVMGATGRAAYLELLWSVDILIPFLAMSFLWAALSRGAFRKWRWSALIGGCADYLENIAITFLLFHYPDRLNGIVQLAAAFTLIKHLGYILVLGFAAIGWGWAVLRHKPLGPIWTENHMV